MWFFYALASAVFASVRRTNEKRISQKLNHFSVGWTVQGFSLPGVSLAMVVSHSWVNPFTLSVSFWVATGIIWFAFYPLNTFCYVNAYRHGEFSKILPLQSLGPVFALITGFLAFGQRPSIMAFFAILVTVVGVYVLNLKGRRLHNPLHMFTMDRPNLYMLCTIVLATLAAMLDTIAIRASNPLFYCFVSTLGAAPVLYVAAHVSKVKERASIMNHLLGLMTAGTLFGLSYSTYLLAIANGPLAYVSAVRSSSIFIGAAIGIFWLQEKLTRQKIAAFVCIAAGLLLFAVA